MQAYGAGQAIAQLDVNWGIDYEPFKDSPGSGPGPASFGTANDCFNLTIEEVQVYLRDARPVKSKLNHGVVLRYFV